MLWLILACANPKTTSPQPQVLPVAPPESQFCDFASKGRACLGQQIRIVGLAQQPVYSHPVLSSTGANAVQSYVDFDDRQFVVLSAEQVSCSHKMEVSGVLREVDLGGPAGTRGSYRNFYIEQSTIRCVSASE